MTRLITRRYAVAALAGLPLFILSPTGTAAKSLPKIVVTKDPTCGCCGGWVDHLRAEGFVAEVIDTTEINRVKARLGVPHELQACHTAEVAGYVIEGHVPAAAIKRLLEQAPKAKGLAVPGMPAGSPGMDVDGAEPEEYRVFLFGTFGTREYARFKGPRELSS